MGKCRIACTIAAVVIGGILVMCNSSPTSNTPPPTPVVLTVQGNTILSEGFEADLSNYMQVVYTEGQAMMSLSKQFANSGKGSLTSDANNTSIKKRIDPAIEDSIAGLQFALLATKKAHTNFIAAICQPGSSANGLFVILGLGIDKSDSLKYYCQTAPDSANITSKNFAPLTLNKWYKCKIEYNYSDTTLTYYVDDAIVGQKAFSGTNTIQMFIVMRDNLGAQGTSGYYLDDASVYKR